MEFFKFVSNSKTTLEQIKNKLKINLIVRPGDFNSLKFNYKEIKNKLNYHLELHNSFYSISEEKNNDNLKIYLDTPEEDNISNEEYLDYDIRVIVGKDDKETNIADKIFINLNRNQEYVSTRGSDEKYLFYDVIRDGLAKDKGLFVPKYFPRFNLKQWERLVNLNYQDRCLRVLESFPIAPLKPKQLSEMIHQAYSTFTNKSVFPLVKISDNQYIMEEFYGPSASFKDLALQLFPLLFQESIKNFNHKICLLVATSGDTGSAVLEGFKESEVPVIVLYPYGKVSQIQEAQMVTAEGNVTVLGVKGDFDFCQSAVKEIFNDQEFTEKLKKDFNLTLSSANSINWGRLLPQVCYSIHSYLELVKEKTINLGDPVDICIPSGNFGNILGAFIAKQMGLSIDKLICASNENNILTDFINSGEFDIRDRNLKETISPAIDILMPSNIERLLYFLTNDSKKVKSYFDELGTSKYFKIDHKLKYEIMTHFLADYCTEEEQIKTIKDVYNETQFIIDPHTAVAKYIADKYSKKRKDSKTSKPILIASTAHYAKFPETVMKALNIPQSTSLKETIKSLKNIKTKSVFHKNLENIMNKKVLHTKVLEKDIGEIKMSILNIASQI